MVSTLPARLSVGLSEKKLISLGPVAVDWAVVENGFFEYAWLGESVFRGVEPSALPCRWETKNERKALPPARRTLKFALMVSQ